MKHIQLTSLLVLTALATAPRAWAQDSKTSTLAPDPQKPHYRCNYQSGGGGTCRVYLGGCANQTQCVVEFEGHWVALTAAHKALIPVENARKSESELIPKTMFPLSPKLDSNLMITEAEVVGMLGSTPPTLSDYDGSKNRFKKCVPNSTKTTTTRTYNVVKPYTLFVDNKCPFSVISVEVILPPGARPAEGQVQGAMAKSGHDLKDVIDETLKNLEFLSEVLPQKRRPLANAFRTSVDDLSLILRLPESRYVNHFRVMEGARNLYVHASALEAMLEKNRNQLTEKYIQHVHNVLSQIIPSFGFNDKSGKDTAIPTGPISKGYFALLTGLDVALQDLIVGLALDSSSEELRAIYDMQSFVQKVKSNASKSDSELTSAISKLQEQWNGRPFQNILALLYSNAQTVAERAQSQTPSLQTTPSPHDPATVCATVKRYPILSLLVSLGESLESFSDEEFGLPFQMECAKK